MILFAINKKITSNLAIYKNDLETKGIYWSIVDRLIKIPKFNYLLLPIVNFLKPNFVMVYGNKMFIDKSDAVISQELILYKTWEDFETKVFLQNIKPGDIVLDVGAHIGYYTLLAARAIGKRGKVYAFEPDLKNFSLLKKNVTINGYKNVILVNSAVTDRNELIKLYINKKNTGDHRTYDSKDKRESRAITSIKLDNFLKGKQRVNIIKMDIQGSEFDAMTGLAEVLDFNKKIRVFTELSPIGLQLNHSSSKKYLNLLRKNNFIIYHIDELKHSISKISDKALMSMYTPELMNNANLLCKRE